MIITESMVVREICDWLAYKNYFFWRENNIPAPGRALPKYTPKGIADILVISEGTVYAFEVKRNPDTSAREPNGRTVRGGMLSPQQAEWGAQLTIAGGVYRCVRSLKEVQEILGG